MRPSPLSEWGLKCLETGLGSGLGLFLLLNFGTHAKFEPRKYLGLCFDLNLVFSLQTLTLIPRKKYEDPHFAITNLANSIMSTGGMSQ